MQPVNPLGIHIQIQGAGGTFSAACLAHVKAANYATVTVLDDFEFARQIKDALPNCVVVFRASDFEPVPGPNAVQQLIAFLNGIQSGDKRIVINVNCERGFSASYCSMWIAMMAAVQASGWKLCVGNVSSGSVKCGQGSDLNEWLTVGSALLKAFAAYPGHYLGVHEYTSFFCWLVANGQWGDPFNPPQAIDWVKPQWHLGRNAQGIAAACKALGIQPPNVIITEGLIDKMNDVTSHYPNDNTDGWRDLTDVEWPRWFPGRNVEDVLADNHIWAWEKVYAPAPVPIVGVHVFTYRDAGGKLWQRFRVDNAPQYLKRMEAYRAGGLQAPAPEPPKPTEPTIPARKNYALKVRLGALSTGDAAAIAQSIVIVEE